MKYNHRNKAAVICLLFLCFCLLLTGCGSRSLKRVLPDGQQAEIRCGKTAALTRTAHFKLGPESVSMYFNGVTWYSAKLVTAREAEALTEGKILLACSSNIRVYRIAEVSEPDGDPRDPAAAPSYLHLLTLEGTQDGFVAFFNQDPPDAKSYGSDFSTNIRFFVGKTETIPDEEYCILS